MGEKSEKEESRKNEREREREREEERRIINIDNTWTTLQDSFC